MSIGRWYRGWSVKGRHGRGNYSYLSGPCKVIKPNRNQWMMTEENGRKVIKKVEE